MAIFARQILILGAGITALFLPQLSAQATAPQASADPAFEVATVRPSAEVNQPVDFEVAPMRFRVVHGTVTDLIRFAYDVRSDDLLVQAPHWTSEERFDIDAKIDDAEAEATKALPSTGKIDQYRLMLRSLLRDRFGLRVNTEERELPVYALEVAKGGPHLTPTSMPAGSLPNIGGWSRGDVEARGVTMALLSEELSGNQELGGRVVMDATGLDGRYDFKIRWTPMAKQTTAERAAPDSAPSSLLTALKEQLGLRLSAQKAAVPVLVIVDVERPSPN